MQLMSIEPPPPLRPPPETTPPAYFAMPPIPPLPKRSLFRWFRKRATVNDPFINLLAGGQVEVQPLPLCDVIPLGETTYTDTCISGTASVLALVQGSTFEVYKVSFTHKWIFDPLCSKVAFGHDASTASFPWRTLTAMSDYAIYIGLPGNCIEVYKVDGRQVKTIKLRDQCRAIVMSRCGQLAAVGTTVGVYLYNAGQDGHFGDTAEKGNEPDIVATTILKVDNYWDDRGAANCMVFSPDSLYMSVCTCENIVHTYSLTNGPGQPILLYKFDRKIDRYNSPGSYHGVTGLALYALLFQLMIVLPTLANCWL